MNDEPKQIEEIPEEFASYEEAADFWDNHDATDYADEFTTVEAEVKLKFYRYEIGINENLNSINLENSGKKENRD
jgi:hypothetical protein